MLILGGGSNILLTKNFDGWVLKNELRGIEELHEDKDFIYVRAGAGENWHSFVQYCITKNWAGLENLSLIPGNVGASPMQNIGAYGVELQDLFWDLEAYHLNDHSIHTFTETDCAFGYRESVFKNKFKNQFIILNVTFRLRKRPVFHTSYGAITEELEKMGVHELSIQAISQAVINIRRAKLPDPEVIGNAGSFFKNPTIPIELFKQLQKKFPGIIGYILPGGTKVKLAAGWLIESCGWRGYRKGDAGCHDKQALVLVNHGNASGTEIFQLSQEIQTSVQSKFGLLLEREVNIY
jgi:UDP-N-acetylmuramate dehydrogenase